MKKEDLQYFGVIFIIIFLASTFTIFYAGREKSTPQLCRQIFMGMVEGRQSVEKFIDWNQLNAFGIDVSAIYPMLPNEKEKADYRREFFSNLSMGFKQLGGRPQAFINWRIFKIEGSKTIVAADYAGENKTVLFTLSKDPDKKLIAIEWEKNE